MLATERVTFSDSGYRNILRRLPGGCVLSYPALPEGFESGIVKDFSGNGNHGTITGATWKQLPSGIRYLNFDGDDLVSGGTAASLFSAAGTFLLWFNCTNGDGNRPLIANDPVLTTVGDFYILRNNTAASGKLRVIWDSPAVDIQGDALLALNVWHHIAVTWGAAGVAMFVNGVKQAATSAEVVTTVRATQTALAIGADRVVSPSAYFVGGIALPKVVNTVLPDPQIASIYNLERPPIGV